MECLLIGCDNPATMDGLCERCWEEVHGEPVTLVDLIGPRAAIFCTVVLLLVFGIGLTIAH
jgi:hypothetical protein